MYDPTFIDVPTEVFGGYCPAIPPSALSPGAASIAQDVMYPQGAVRTRGGMFNFFPKSPIPADAAVNGLKSYITPTLAQRLMVWDSDGNFYKEINGLIQLVNARPYKNLFYESCTLFGREYQAFFNGLGGFDIPRQFDDLNWDRVSQVGPGSAPIATNYVPPAAAITNPGSIVSFNIVATPNGIVFSGLQKVQDGGNAKGFAWTYFIVTTTAPNSFTAGVQVTIAGATIHDPSIFINSTWEIDSIISSTQFRVNFTTPDNGPAYGGGGTVDAAVGNVSLIRKNNICTANTTAAHGFQPGWTIQISGFADIAVGTAISSILQSAGEAICATTDPHGLVPGAAVIITGTTNFNSPAGGWIVTSTPNANTFTFVFLQNVAFEVTGTAATPINCTSQIIAVPTPTSFTYAQIGPDEASTSSGTATVVGNISGGLHLVSVSGITRQGFITQPAPWAQFYAVGNQLAGLSQIPTGPPNWAGRLLMFTPVIQPPATTGSFYSLTQSMVINDNTTTAAVVDFADIALIAGFQCNYLFTQLELGESAFVIGYNSRMFWLGERAKVPNFNNLTFDGGFTPDAFGNNVPNGWSPTYNVFSALVPNVFLGSSALADNLPPDWGDAYVIAGGVTSLVVPYALTGKITQTAYQDMFGVPIIQANTSYSVRVRVRLTAIGAPKGVLHINLQSTLQNFTSGGLALPVAKLSMSYQEFSVPLIGPLAVVPSDLLLQVYADGSPSAGPTFIVDSIEVFPTLAPFNYSTARGSHAFNPESYDGTTGQIQIRPGDGQQLRAGFPLRNNLYLAKDHYLCYVTDDGINEPASWAVNEVSATVGICGPNAVDWNEEWAVWAERSGAYICWGSDPVKISPEIQLDAAGIGRPSWASINWAAASTIVVRIDKDNRQILFLVPINGATSPNAVFLLDYKWLDGAQDIASSPLVTYSSFTGKILSHGRGRRWAVWNLAANSMTFAERPDGSVQPFFGNGAGNGKIYQQLDCAAQASDDGVAIASFWAGYGSPSSMEEQMFQLGAHRKLLGYMKWRAIGNGMLRMQIGTTLRTTPLRPYPLTAPAPGDSGAYGEGGYGTGGYGAGLPSPWIGPPGDGERSLQISGERFYPQVGTNAVGDWFQLERLTLCMKKHPTLVVRGANS